MEHQTRLPTAHRRGENTAVVKETCGCGCVKGSSGVERSGLFLGEEEEAAEEEVVAEEGGGDEKGVEWSGKMRGEAGVMD